MKLDYEHKTGKYEKLRPRQMKRSLTVLNKRTQIEWKEKNGQIE